MVFAHGKCFSGLAFPSTHHVKHSCLPQSYFRALSAHCLLGFYAQAVSEQIVIRGGQSPFSLQIHLLLVKISTLRLNFAVAVVWRGGMAQLQCVGLAEDVVLSVGWVLVQGDELVD